MTLSLQRNFHGPLWPLGLISVATPGIPVGFMNLVDPAAYKTSVVTPTLGSEYAVRAHEMVIQAYKPGLVHGMQFNSGNVYVLVAPAGGSGNRDDSGSIITTLGPGQTMFLESAAMNFNVWSPYTFFVDADNPGDGVMVTLIIQ